MLHYYLSLSSPKLSIGHRRGSIVQLVGAKLWASCRSDNKPRPMRKLKVVPGVLAIASSHQWNLLGGMISSMNFESLRRDRAVMTRMISNGRLEERDDREEERRGN